MVLISTIQAVSTVRRGPTVQQKMLLAVTAVLLDKPLTQRGAVIPPPAELKALRTLFVILGTSGTAQP